MKMDSKFENDMEIEHEFEHDSHYTDKDKKHKMMSMEDVAEQLSKDFADEIADSKKYFRMAKTVEKVGDREDCYYLMEMSKDEFTHAYFIHNFMTEHDIDIPEDLEEDFEKLKDKMKRFFR